MFFFLKMLSFLGVLLCLNKINMYYFYYSICVVVLCCLFYDVWYDYASCVDELMFCGVCAFVFILL